MKIENINAVNDLVENIDKLENIISILDDLKFSRFDSVKKIIFRSYNLKLKWEHKSNEVYFNEIDEKTQTEITNAILVILKNRIKEIKIELEKL